MILTLFFDGSSRLLDVKQHLVLFTKSAKTHETRFAVRALRSVTSLRKRLTASVLARAIAGAYGKGNALLFLQVECGGYVLDS